MVFLRIREKKKIKLQYGISKSKRKEENQTKLNIFLNRLEGMDFTEKCAFYYGRLRAELEQKRASPFLLLLIFLKH